MNSDITLTDTVCWIHTLCVSTGDIIHVFHRLTCKESTVSVSRSCWMLWACNECEWRDNTKTHRGLFGSPWACLLFGSVSMTQRDIPHCLWSPLLSSLFPFLPPSPPPPCHSLLPSLPPTMFIPTCDWAGRFFGLDGWTLVLVLESGAGCDGEDQTEEQGEWLCHCTVCVCRGWFVCHVEVKAPPSGRR